MFETEESCEELHDLQCSHKKDRRDSFYHNLKTFSIVLKHSDLFQRYELSELPSLFSVVVLYSLHSKEDTCPQRNLVV